MEPAARQELFERDPLEFADRLSANARKAVLDFASVYADVYELKYVDVYELEPTDMTRLAHALDLVYENDDFGPEPYRLALLGARNAFRDPPETRGEFRDLAEKVRELESIVETDLGVEGAFTRPVLRAIGRVVGVRVDPNSPEQRAAVEIILAAIK